jgi:hypothetical protein
MKVGGSGVVHEAMCFFGIPFYVQPPWGRSLRAKDSFSRQDLCDHECPIQTRIFIGLLYKGVSTGTIRSSAGAHGFIAQR